MNTVSIYVEDIAARIADYDEIRLYRGVSPFGPFSTTVTDITLVSSQYAYSYDDSAGDDSSWYVYVFRNSDTLEVSAESSPFRPRGGTLAQIAFDAAAMAGAAFEGTATGGTSTTLIDPLLVDGAQDEGAYSGMWIRRRGAAAADRVRAASNLPFDVAAASITVTRAWSSAPEADEAYEVFAILPPDRQRGRVFSWSDAVREGLREIWLEDEIVVGIGDGEEREFPLTAVPALLDKNRRRGVIVRRVIDGQAFDTDQQMLGRFVDFRAQAGSATLVLPYAPMTDDLVIVKVVRQPDTPWRDTDYIDVDAELAAAAGAMAAYRRLNGIPATRGQYAAELAAAEREFNDRYAPKRPHNMVIV